MDETTKRKLNLLIHLAKIDGHYHKAEQRLIEEFVIDNNLPKEDFKLMAHNKDDTLEWVENRGEMLYLAIKLMQADDVIHQKERAFCKEVAFKLGFKPAIIDEYAEKHFSREVFDKDIEHWLM